MSQPWEWVLSSYNGERPIETDLVLSANDEDYGGGYDYDELEPIERVTLDASGMVWSEIETLSGYLRTRGHVFTATDKEGRTWEGRLTSVNAKNIDGSIHYDVQVGIKLPQTTP